MLLDAETFQAGHELSADVCIVGSGPAGMTIARDLIGSGLSVLLLESGGPTSEDTTQRLYAGRMIGLGLWTTDRQRLRQYGGSSNHWAGFCRPLQPEDFEARAWMPGSGWPIAYSDISPFYADACDTLEIGPFNFDAGDATAAAGEDAFAGSSGGIDTRFYQFSPPTRFASVYGPALEADASTTVVFHANAVELRLSDDLARIDRIRCSTLGGTEFTATAARFVLATGGIENPRLLLASNQQIDSGVANSSGAVGRYFMEHPHYYGAGVFTLSAAAPFGFFNGVLGVQLSASGVTRAANILGAIGLDAATREREQLPAVTITLDERDSPDTGPLRVRDVERLLRDPSGPRRFSLTLRCEQTPYEESRVTLHNSNVDALGMPRVDVNWQLRDEDLVAYARTLELMGIALGAEGVGRAWCSRVGDMLSFRLNSGGHHMGTTRMGSDAATSVVDANSRAHDVANLFIAGSSVFRTGGEANPTLTIVALAHRLAAALMESP